MYAARDRLNSVVNVSRPSPYRRSKEYAACQPRTAVRNLPRNKNAPPPAATVTTLRPSAGVAPCHNAACISSGAPWIARKAGATSPSARPGSSPNASATPASATIGNSSPGAAASLCGSSACGEWAWPAAWDDADSAPSFGGPVSAVCGAPKNVPCRNTKEYTNVRQLPATAKPVSSASVSSTLS